MNSKFKAVVAILLFPFLWALLGTMLYLVMTMINDGIVDVTNKVMAGFLSLVMLIISYCVIFTTED